MSSLRVYRSNHIELLAELLGRFLQAAPPADPFAPIEIVVGSRGMERWLRHTLAEHLGVCANIRFPFPTGWLDDVLAQVLDEAAEDACANRWTPSSLAWALLEVLPKLVERPGFEAVRAYDESWDGPVSAKAYGLARQLGDVLDRYVVYRPEMACAWSAGEPAAVPAGAEALSWQWALWQELVRHFESAPHRAERIRDAERLLRSGAVAPRFAGPVRLFGISSLPPVWMPLLGALAEHVEVDLFLLCPSNEYWAELVGPRVRRDRAAWRLRDRDEIIDALRDPARPEVHPLLVSMGRVARDFQIVLESQAEDYEDARVDLFLDGREAFPDPAGNGSPRALRRLQSDLLGAQAPADSSCLAGLDPGDDSVQFHHCYGATRQVEVLRDLILGLFEDHPHLEPRDVVVMTPEIETYAPLVTAVFSQGRARRVERDGEPILGADGWGPAGAPYVPFELADLSVRRLNPVADAVLRALELVDGRFEASAVLDLLTLEPVRQRFRLSAEELLTVRTWLGRSGIRWARDAVHRAAVGQPADPQNTWRFGLRRLLLGVALADDGRTVSGIDEIGNAIEVRPFDDMEGDGVDLLGKLVDFTNTLFALTDGLREARPVANWVAALDSLVDRLTLTSSNASWLTRRAREGIRQLEADADCARSRRAVSVAAIRSALEGHFEVASRVSHEQSGAVLFCAMQPMRSVPYRVVCLLGMDEGALPRKGSSQAFDLVSRAPRVGDQTPRDEDRYLVLEALLSAREHLIVLHSGHDPRTNEDRPACVPVGELRDLVDLSFACPAGVSSPSEWMTTHHPLQPFGPKAFLPLYRDPTDPESARPWSFDRRLLAGAEATRRPRQSRAPFFAAADDGPASPQTEAIELDDLIRFLSGPTAYLLQRRLKLNLREDDELLDDREPVELDHLQRWRLRNALLEERLEGRETPPVISRLAAAGELPLGFAGRATADQQAKLVEEMLDKVAIWPTGAAGPVAPDDPLSVDIQLANARITGTLKSLYGKHLVDLQFGGGEGTKKLARVWLSLLVWHACREDAGRAVLALGTLAKGAPAVSLYGYEAPEDARGCLERLVAIYRLGCSGPVKLFPGASWSFAWAARTLLDDAELFSNGLPEEDEKIRKISKALDSAAGSWWPGYQGGGDLDDPHIERVFDGTPPIFDPHVQPVPVDLQFARLACDVWRPLILGRKTSRVVKKWIDGGLR